MMSHFRKFNDFLHKRKPEKTPDSSSQSLKIASATSKKSLDMTKKTSETNKLPQKASKISESNNSPPETSKTNKTSETDEKKENEEMTLKDQISSEQFPPASDAESPETDAQATMVIGTEEYEAHPESPASAEDNRRESISVYYQARQSLISLNEKTFMTEDVAGESNGPAVEKHKSVITHLLTQVKLGMDMTKVTLPTFILEKRSLLEMYADFFSHADYFIEIAKAETSEDRFMACMRFYLSTFSAGRNSAIAKKPYNPILGEIFRCFWDDDSLKLDKKKAQTATEGPVPWCTTDQLSFIGEQVSHHPPVSAFYAEHQDLQIQFNGHIWTKSKFMGLSVAVHNIGQGAIYLAQHDEEYVVNFPSGYGRSILSVPWIELGGDCTMTCEKTGYSGIIKFHMKPFYGGKVHKVTGEIVKPNESKPIYTFEGSWNGVIDFKTPKGITKKFFDATKPKMIKKVKIIKMQEPTESRRLWQHVTENLKNNHIEKATEAKQALEQTQRNEAKLRLVNAIDYKPKRLNDIIQNDYKKIHRVSEIKP